MQTSLLKTGSKFYDQLKNNHQFYQYAMAATNNGNDKALLVKMLLSFRQKLKGTHKILTCLQEDGPYLFMYFHLLCRE
jgi:hypothetical protein